MKRKSPYEINQNNLSDDEHPAPELGQISTPEEIAQRRIVRVKGRSSASAGAAPGEEAGANAKLVLAQKLDEGKTETEAKTTEDSTEQKKTTEEPKKLEFSATSSLFGGAGAAKPTAAADATTTEAPKTGGLFGNISTTSSIFGIPSTTGSNLFGSISTGTTTASGLFGGQGTGLFANIKKDADAKPSVTNIFSVAQPTGGLFANLPTTSTTSSIFGNANPSQATSSIFGNLSSTAASSGLFAAVPSNNANGSEDEDGGEDEDDQEASPEIDTTNQVMYQYNNPYEKIIDKAIVKLRRGTGDVLEKGTISLEKLKEDDKTPALFAYRNQIKTLIFSYNVYKKISKVEKISEQTKNLKLTFVKQNDEGAMVGDVIKVQFTDEKEGQEFFDKLTECIKE